MNKNWDGKIQIKNKRINSANVQAELYRRLRARGIDSILEYSHGNCRFDLAVVVGNDIVAIVECKNTTTKTRPNFNGRQYKKYSSLGIPLLYCLNFSELDDTVKSIIVILQRTYNLMIS